VTLPASLADLALAALCLATLSGGYVLVCAGWPFARCRRCHGTGSLRAPIGRGRRLCLRCDATGLRLRIGRRVWNHLRRLRREGSR
jgi:hypothetical protein